jgi:hypothetical protein
MITEKLSKIYERFSLKEFPEADFYFRSNVAKQILPEIESNPDSPIKNIEFSCEQGVFTITSLIQSVNLIKSIEIFDAMEGEQTDFIPISLEVNPGSRWLILNLSENNLYLTAEGGGTEYTSLELTLPTFLSNLKRNFF